MAIVTNLKVLLIQRREPQYEFAAKVGMSESRLSRIIRGRLTPTEAERARIAEELGVAKSDLFADTRKNHVVNDAVPSRG